MYRELISFDELIERISKFFDDFHLIHDDTISLAEVW